jgi:hypothetical protein
MNQIEDQLRDELDSWEMVQYRMDAEGIEYCFRDYSSFPEIEDEEFHSLRKKLLDVMEEMEAYVADKIWKVEDKIIALDDE